jgi:hypothetical protein
MTDVIDFRTKQLEQVDEGNILLSKAEILDNIIELLSSSKDSIDTLVIAYSTKDDVFSANANTSNAPEILWLLENAKLGIFGV